MRFTDPRVQALLSVLCIFRLLPRGFTNQELREHVEPLLGHPPGAISSGRGTYDLRRLRHHGLIQRIPRSHRYRVTEIRHRQALFLSRAHQWLVTGGLAELTEPTQADAPRRLRAASNAYDLAVEDLLRIAGLAA